MKLNFMASWNDAIAILRAQKESIVAIAGVFIFLPSLLIAQFIGEPPIEGTEDFAALAAIMSEHFNENAVPIILSNILISFGGLAIYFAISPSKSGTVGDNLAAALKAFLIFFAANIMTGLLSIGGLFLFIIPGLYVGCRLVLVPLIITDLGERNPIESLKRSWEMTKDNGFPILLYLLMISIAGYITIGVVQAVIGLIARLATSGTGLPLLENFVASFTGTAFQILLAVVIAGIYAQLSGKKSDVEDIFG